MQVTSDTADNTLAIFQSHLSKLSSKHWKNFKNLEMLLLLRLSLPVSSSSELEISLTQMLQGDSRE